MTVRLNRVAQPPPGVKCAMLKIIVEHLREGPLRVALDALPSELDLTDPNYSFPHRVQGELEFKLIGRDVRGVGELHLDAAAPCVRCLEPTRNRVSVPVSAVWLFRDPETEHYPIPPSDEILAEYFSDESIEITPTLRELILTALPNLPVCAPECKGLCPRCGANLNRESCGCQKNIVSVGTMTEWKSQLLRLKSNMPSENRNIPD